MPAADHTCQETDGEGIRCGAPATNCVDNGDERPYWMCAPHTLHNVQNRRGIIYVPFNAPRKPTFRTTEDKKS